MVIINRGMVWYRCLQHTVPAHRSTVLFLHLVVRSVFGGSAHTSSVREEGRHTIKIPGNDILPDNIPSQYYS